MRTIAFISVAGLRTFQFSPLQPCLHFGYQYEIDETKWGIQQNAIIFIWWEMAKQFLKS